MSAVEADVALVSSPQGVSRKPFIQRPGVLTTLFLMPAALLLVVFLIIPLSVTVWMSLSPNVLVKFQGHTFANYTYVFGRSYYIQVLWRTVRIAAETSSIAFLLGYPAALALRYVPPALSNAFVLAVTLPVLCGPLVVILGWMILLSRGGPLGSLVGDLQLLGSEWGIVVAQVHFLLPFVVLSLVNVLHGIPDELLDAARSLGAGPVRRFLRIILPLSLPGILSALIIGFSLATGAFVAPHYLGGPGDLTLATLISQFVMATFNGQLAATVSILLLAVMSAAIFTLTIVLSWKMRG